MKLIKKIVLTSFYLLFVMFQLGCSPNETNQNITLSLYYPHHANEEFYFLINKYSLAYPEVEVVTYDPSGGDDSLSAEQLASKMTTDILAGIGPDVIINDSSQFSLKMMKGGAYRDMSDFYDKDELMHSGLFEEDIMDAGVFGDRRCFIPLSYSITALVSTRERLEEVGFDEAAFGTSRAFTDELFEFLSSEQSMCYSQIETKAIFLQRVVPSLIDTSTLTVSADREEMKYYFDLIRLAREKEKRSPYPYYRTDYFGYPNTDALWGWTNSEYLFLKDSSLWNSIYHASMMQSEQSPVITPLLNFNDCMTCEPRDIVAVRNNCKNPEAAYRLIQMMLLEDFQENQLIGSWTPVRKEAQQVQINNILERREDGKERSVNPDGTEGEGYTITEWTPEFEEAAKKALDCPKTVVFGLDPYMEQFNKYMEPYYDGTASYEECFDRARGQVETMLSE